MGTLITFVLFLIIALSIVFVIALGMNFASAMILSVIIIGVTFYAIIALIKHNNEKKAAKYRQEQEKIDQETMRKVQIKRRELIRNFFETYRKGKSYDEEIELQELNKYINNDFRFMSDTDFFLYRYKITYPYEKEQERLIEQKNHKETESQKLTERDKNVKEAAAKYRQEQYEKKKQEEVKPHLSEQKKTKKNIGVTKLKEMKKILGIDFETANPTRASACSVGLYLKEFNGNVLYEKEILINPECEFSYFNIDIHGITPEMVADSPNFNAVFSKIINLIDDDTVVIAHNASFDISVLRHSCDRYYLKKPTFTYLCTLVMARALIAGLSSYRLNVLAEHLNLGDFEHHNALSDAKMCVNLFEYLMDSCGCKNKDDFIKKRIASFGWVDGETNKYSPCSTYHKNNIADNEESVSTQEHNPEHPFYNKVVVFTGTLKSMSRDIASAKVTAIGGVVGNGLTKNTNYLVFGHQDKNFLNGKDKSNKLIKAEEYIKNGADLQIISEVEFVQMV